MRKRGYGQSALISSLAAWRGLPETPSYSASKAAAELVAASYRDAFLREQGVAVATARAGNVIGGGDWSEDRLLPDAVRAWQDGRTLDIRNPVSVRPDNMGATRTGRSVQFRATSARGGDGAGRD
ncbi:hypothetical protein G6F63_014936 [Rhizopus arrhizus]|nr:hypothetical protein G6F63_014936 [Rhizopus arrhizus]